MSLEEAIERVQRVYERERLHPAPTDVVAQHLGYKGASNGAALSALASVRYFGLVDRPRDGYLGITKDYERYKFAPDDRQRSALLIGFLRKPALYVELLDKYSAGLPSDANLRFELIERGFSPVSAEAALAAFRRSVDFANYYGNTVQESEPLAPNEELDEEAPMDGRNASAPASQSMGSNQNLEASFPSTPKDDSTDQIPVRLPGGRRAWLLIPTPFFEADKARLKAQIDLLLTQDEEDRF